MFRIAVLVTVIAAVPFGVTQATGQGNLPDTPTPQPNPCEGHVAEFADLAQRAWHPRRWDWWTSHPPTKRDMRQLKELRPCSAESNTRSRLKEIWAGQRRQFERAWVGRLGGPGNVSWLRSTRACESGGNYRIATGNGFYGAYQFDYRSWLASGGNGFAHQAPAREQDYRAIVWLRLAGSGAWPNCG